MAGKVKPNGNERTGKRSPSSGVPGVGGTGTGTGTGTGKRGTQPPAESTTTGTDDEGSADLGTEFIDPGAATGPSSTGPSSTSSTSADEGEPKRRGRPPGSRTRTSSGKEKIPSSLEGIEGILLSLHTMGATFAKVPELVITDEEAKKLSAAIDRVAALYDFGATEKTLAWVNLAMCVGGIYGTRLFVYSMRTKAEEEMKKKTTVLQFERPMNNAGAAAL